MLPHLKGAAMTKDRILSITILLLLALMYKETYKFSEKTDWLMFAPSFYPRIVIITVGVVTLFLLIRSFIVPKGSGAKPGASVAGKKYAKVLLMFFLTVVYVSVLPLWGFIVSTILYLMISQLALGGIRNTKNVAFISAVSCSAVFIVHMVFQNVLKIWLP